jgi:hypothetical protein
MPFLRRKARCLSVAGHRERTVMILVIFSNKRCCSSLDPQRDLLDKASGPDTDHDHANARSRLTSCDRNLQNETINQHTPYEHDDIGHGNKFRKLHA